MLSLQGWSRATNSTATTGATDTCIPSTTGAWDDDTADYDPTDRHTTHHDATKAATITSDGLQ